MPCWKICACAGMTNCLPCEAGRYQDEIGQSVCKKCESGYKCPWGAPTQFDCNENTTCIFDAMRTWQDCVDMAIARDMADECSDIGDINSGILKDAVDECDVQSIVGNKFVGAKGKLEELRNQHTALVN